MYTDSSLYEELAMILDLPRLVERLKTYKTGDVMRATKISYPTIRAIQRGNIKNCNVQTLIKLQNFIDEVENV